MKKGFFITFPIILILSAFYFFFLTYISNQSLYFNTLLLKQAGHIVVPDATILSSMLDFKVVLFGSFFITFTAGLTIAFTISIIVSTFFISRDSFFKIAEIFLPIVISITLLITTLYVYNKNNLFPRIRDSFLLSNSVGNSINDFYYKYTLYAAEALQSPLQKQIKPCWIDPNIEEKAEIKKALFQFGWLTTNRITNNNLVIKKNFKSKLDFVHNNKLLFRTSIEEFLTNPERFLSIYSKKIDSKKSLRILSSLGLMPGIPLFLFSFVYFIIFIFFLVTKNSKNASLFSSSITAFLFIGLLFYLNPEILTKPNIESTRNLVFSSEARDRIHGLRVIYTEKYEIKDFTHLASELLKGNAVEKFWLANTLSMHRTKQNIRILKTLIKDESMNVRYAAISALSAIDPSKKSLKIFKQVINNSNSTSNQNNNHWYVQLYAYNAYKKWIVTNTTK
ncbi:MAG: HEAT repeat domain-containing protein [Desulfobacterales bacterium]|nr:HEAT repeat domain-containing protein [Desulfobacterales bacterium]